MERLAEILVELAEAGCHNWNLVTPGPWLPFIRAAAAQARARGVSLPFVYNTSGYERVEVAEAFHDLIDVALVDLRYATSDVAREGSSAPDYPDQARRFLRWAWDRAGPLHVDDDGVATCGTIVRILVLPGHADEAIANLEWMADAIGTDVHLSVMSQYTPVHAAAMRPGWDRVITEAEYAVVVDAVDHLGFANGWIQEFGACAPDDGLLGCNMQPGAGVAGAGRCAEARLFKTETTTGATCHAAG
ncbi:MAG: radical SAM protein [Kiritimatiellia bacterium]